MTTWKWAPVPPAVGDSSSTVLRWGRRWRIGTGDFDDISRQTLEDGEGS